MAVEQGNILVPSQDHNKNQPLLNSLEYRNEIRDPNCSGATARRNILKVLETHMRKVGEDNRVYEWFETLTPF